MLSNMLRATGTHWASFQLRMKHSMARAGDGTNAASASSGSGFIGLAAFQNCAVVDSA